jgi:uncharacterized protein (DUF2147 family)
MRVLKSMAVGALLVALGIAPALAADPTGTWQSTGGESRYAISYCGSGKQLCAKLVWLRADARTAENLRYLNHYVVKGAKRDAANTWAGTLTYAGQSYAGKLTLVSTDAMRLKGCKGLFCTTMSFERI